MSVQGDDLLEAIVKYGYTDGLADRVRGISLSYVARVLTGAFDGRKVIHRAKKLQSAGLIEIERRGDTTFAKPTQRGIEVDGILERITAARGGEFAPRAHAGITAAERVAL